MRLAATSLFIVAGFACFGTSQAQAADIYYYTAGTTNNSWDTVSKWWLDSAHTVPADRLPQAGDDVYVDQNLTAGPSATTTVTNLYVGQTSDARFVASVTVTGTAVFGATGSGRTLTYFSGPATITGNAVFNDATYIHQGAVVNGNVTLNDTAHIGIGFGNPTVNGNVTLNDSSYVNGGNITGVSTLNDSSSIQLGEFNGDIHLDTTAHLATGGVLTVEGVSSFGLTMSGGIMYGSDDVAISSVVVNDSVILTGRMPFNTTFNDTSRLDGAVLGNATFNTTYYNATAPVAGTFTFSSQNWSGEVIGSVYGSDSALIAEYIFEGTVGADNTSVLSGGVTLNDDAFFSGNLTGDISLNSGSRLENAAITGDATFNTTYYDATAPSGGTFNLSLAGWDSTVSGVVYGSDAAEITDYVVSGGVCVSRDLVGDVTVDDGCVYGDVTGNAVFNGFSYHEDSRISGNAVFNGDSYTYSGTIGGNATFNDASYLETGVVEGDATFNTTYYGDSAPSSGLFTILYGTEWGGDIRGTVYGSDSEPVTEYSFSGDGSAISSVGVIRGDVTFGQDTYNGGGIIGNVTFNFNSSNEGDESSITGDAVFNDSSYFGSGTITGDATFNSDYYAGSTGGVLTFGSGTYWQGVVTGTVYGSDLAPIEQYVFENGSTNEGGIITGDVTFNGNSYMIGEVVGDVTFNGSSYLRGAGSGAATVTGDATFNDSSYNDEGTVTGNAIFAGNLSENQDGTVGGTVTRLYSLDIAVTRDFTDLPWIVVADGAVVDMTGAIYNGSNSFEARNGGSFVPTNLIEEDAPAPVPAVETSRAKGTSSARRASNLASMGVSSQASPLVASGGDVTVSTVDLAAFVERLRALLGVGTGQVITVSDGVDLSGCPDLELGSSHACVRSLQVRLNALGFAVATTGPGSVGLETSYFGPATRSALARFQTSEGISPAAGYFGPRTRAVIK